MNINRRFKNYLVPEYKNFNEDEYFRLRKKDEESGFKTNVEYKKYTDLMSKDVETQLLFNKRILPLVKKFMLFLILIMTALMVYLLILGIPLAKKEYQDYKINQVLEEKRKNEKAEVIIINDEKHGMYCDKEKGYIYIDGKLAWINGCDK